MFKKLLLSIMIMLVIVCGVSAHQVYEPQQMLGAISNLQAAYKAETGEYLSIDKNDDEGWYKIGFDINPNTFSDYYTFDVVSDGKSFIAKAILNKGIVNAKKGDYLTIDENNKWTCSICSDAEAYNTYCICIICGDVKTCNIVHCLTCDELRICSVKNCILGDCAAKNLAALLETIDSLETKLSIDTTALLDSIDVLLAQLEDCGKSPIIPQSARNVETLFVQNIVSDKMEINLSGKVSFVVYDMTGNIVANQNGKVWDLRNSAGRFVANGTYLVVVECGNEYYSAKIGVKR